MQWYDWHTVTDRLEGRCLALTEGLPFSVSLSLEVETATCNNTTGQIVINPVAFNNRINTSNASLRDKTNYLVTRALLGHEVLHALYSSAAGIPADPVLRTISNVLEDARIEKIGAADSYVNRELFKLLNNLAAKSQPRFMDLDMNDPSSWVQVMLMWRFGMELPALNKPEDRTLMVRIIDVCEQALYAIDTAEVNKLSRKLKDICGLKTNHLNPDAFNDDSVGDLSSTMTGPGECRPNPCEKPKQKSQSKSSRKSSKSKDNKASKESEEPAQKVSESRIEEPEVKKHEETLAEPEPEKSEEENISLPEDSNEPEHGDSGDSDYSGETELDALDDSTSCSDSHSSCGAGGSGTEAAMPSLEDMVDDLQDKLGEDFESSLQELDKLSKDSSVPAEDRYNSDDCFTINQAPYQELLTMARPLAKQIVRELKLQAPNTNTAPDKSVGRFKMRYYIRNNETPFARRKTEGRDVPPIAISLIIDRSGSMICSTVALKVTAMAIVSACEQLRIPLDIRIFTGNNHIKEFDEWGPQIYSRIAGTKVLGGTFLLPSLVSAAKDLKDRPEPLKQTILIHDGTPDDHSSVVEWLNKKSNPDIFAMYLLPNNISAEESECRTTKGTLYMSTLFDPRNFVVMESDKALAYWCSYMKTYRNHFSKVR